MQDYSKQLKRTVKQPRWTQAKQAYQLGMLFPTVNDGPTSANMPTASARAVIVRLQPKTPGRICMSPVGESPCRSIAEVVSVFEAAASRFHTKIWLPRIFGCPAAASNGGRILLNQGEGCSAPRRHLSKGI